MKRNATAVWHGTGKAGKGKVATQGKTLDSTAQPLTAGATRHKEFHLAQPAGWKPGTYLVTLYLNGDSDDAKTFAVRK